VKRTRLAVVASVLAFASLGATAPAANACTGLPCDAFCAVWTAVTHKSCPIR
jgi:hypothetical protein